MQDNQLLIFHLVEALRQWLCPACGGRKIYINRGFKEEKDNRTGPRLIKGKFYNEEVPCTKCKGTGLHPIAQEAIDKVEGTNHANSQNT